MLQIRNLHYDIADRQLLRGVDWIINPGRRMALVGVNGVGKTTLFRILTGEVIADRGDIDKPKHYRIGYLPQEEVPLAGTTVIRGAMAGREDLLKIEHKIRRIQDRLDVTDDQSAALLGELGDLQHRYDAAGGWSLEKEAEKILSGLGFSPEELTRPLVELSGGWKMRVYLARLLLLAPDLLLLDEPTNHLDLPSLEWLEQYLLNVRGSVVLISHDRYFIDRLAQEIYELDNGRLSHFAGDYAFYWKEKEAELDRLVEKRLQQLKMKKHQEAFINRFRAKNTKATQVQSRIKQLEKVEIVELPPQAQQLDFSIPLETVSYKHVLHMGNISFSYDQAWALKDLSLDIYRGERIALVGPNGEGKTTLTKLIAGQLSTSQGKVVLGERVKIGYYAQHQIEALNLEATAFAEVAAGASEQNITRIREVLGIFQIKGDDVLKKVKVLSGGEKARVSLAKILLSPFNFLIMDEPTNHLDPLSKEALEKALAGYGGTILLISHDRYFLDRITQKVYELKGGKIEEYFGNYTHYLEKRRQAETESDPKTAEGASTAKGGLLKKDRQEERRVQAQNRQRLSKERNELARSIESFENQIEQLELRKVEIETQMADPGTYEDGDLVVRLQKERADVAARLQTAMASWETAQNRLERILSELQI